MNALIAGASGFIGRNFLLKTPSNWKIDAIYNNSVDFPEFCTQSGLDHVTSIQCDLSNSAQVSNKFQKENKYDFTLFVLGNSNIGLSASDPMFDIQSNIHTLVNLIKNTSTKKFIFMSSGTVYLGHQDLVNDQTITEPLVPYGINKLASELFIKFFQAKTDHIDSYVNLRFFGAYGPMELDRKIYTNLIKTFAFENKNEFTVMGGGLNLIDAMYIDDTIEGLFKVIKSQTINVTVDFCKGEPLSINQLILDIAKYLGKNDINLIHQGESSEYITFRASPDRMKKYFDFEANISLNDGINRFADYLKNSHVKTT